MSGWEVDGRLDGELILSPCAWSHFGASHVDLWWGPPWVSNFDFAAGAVLAHPWGRDGMRMKWVNGKVDELGVWDVRHCLCLIRKSAETTEIYENLQ